MAPRAPGSPPKPATTPTPIAIGLARASTDQQDHSVADQQAEIERWCHDNGHTLVQPVFQDDGVSGSKLDREGLTNLMRFVPP